MSLTWETDEEDFEDLMGYHIYRWTEGATDSIIINDDEKLLDLVQTIFENIDIESIKDKNTKHKAILHTKLNIYNNKDKTINIDEFLLLFRKH